MNDSEKASQVKFFKSSSKIRSHFVVPSISDHITVPMHFSMYNGKWTGISELQRTTETSTYLFHHVSQSLVAVLKPRLPQIWLFIHFLHLVWHLTGKSLKLQACTDNVWKPLLTFIKSDKCVLQELETWTGSKRDLEIIENWWKENKTEKTRNTLGEEYIDTKSVSLNY